MRYVSDCFRIIALSCVLVTLTACSVAQPLADQRDRLIGMISNSVAVLPFESNSPELADFAADVYEEALNQLAADSDLYVVGREATLPYLSLNLDPEEIALQLGVGHVLGGRIDYINITSTSRGFSVAVSYLYRHTGQHSIRWQGTSYSPEWSLSDLLNCQSVITSGVASTVKGLVLRESVSSSDEPPLPIGCRS